METIISADYSHKKDNIHKPQLVAAVLSIATNMHEFASRWGFTTAI